MRLHRIVVEGRRLVGDVDCGLRGGERGLDVALLGVGLEARVDLVGLVQARVVRAQLGVVRLLVVLHVDEALRLARDLQRLGNDGGDDLPAVGNAVGLE